MQANVIWSWVVKGLGGAVLLLERMLEVKGDVPYGAVQELLLIQQRLDKAVSNAEERSDGA